MSSDAAGLTARTGRAFVTSPASTVALSSA